MVPPLPAVLNIVRITLKGTWGEDADVINRFYMDNYDETSEPSNLNAFCTSVGTAWATNMASVFDASYVLTEVSAEDLSDSTSPFGVATVSHAGTRATNPISGSACVVLQFKIGRRYRGGHPRMYLSALGDSDQTDAQTWNPTSLAAVVTAWNAFIPAVRTAMTTAYPGSAGVQQNVSFYEGFTNVTYPSGRTYPRPTLRATPVVDEVIGVAANPKIGSQRRRNLTP